MPSLTPAGIWHALTCRGNAAPKPRCSCIIRGRLCSSMCRKPDLLVFGSSLFCIAASTMPTCLQAQRTSTRIAVMKEALGQRVSLLQVAESIKQVYHILGAPIIDISRLWKTLWLCSRTPASLLARRRLVRASLHLRVAATAQNRRCEGHRCCFAGTSHHNGQPRLPARRRHALSQ